MNLLLADDDEDDQFTFREALREIDSSIVLLSASNGIEALSILGNLHTPPDHIFLDINMPLLGGVDCLKKIRMNSIFVPVTIYSTANPNNDINDCIKLGADYWQKPNTYKEIVRGLKLRLKKIATADLKQLVDEGATSIRRAFKGLDVVIAEIDKDLRYKWIENPHPDFRPDEVIGKRDDDLLPMDEAEQIISFKRSLFRTETYQLTSMCFTRSNGKNFYTMHGYPIQNEKGNICSVITVSFLSHVEPIQN